MEIVKNLAGYAGDICQILALAALVIKPIREWLFGTEKVREGQRCVLRSEIVRIYYHNLTDKSLHEYEYQNMAKCYSAYKALSGNSFIDHLYAEMQKWEITQ